MSFQSNCVIETGLSDHYEFIATFVKSHFTILIAQRLFTIETLKNLMKSLFQMTQKKQILILQQMIQVRIIAPLRRLLLTLSKAIHL